MASKRGNQVVGGPFDGYFCHARGGKVAFLEEVEVKGEVRLRAEKDPARGRVPYYIESTRFRFVGYGFKACRGCGAHLDPSRSDFATDIRTCPLCGSTDLAGTDR